MRKKFFLKENRIVLAGDLIGIFGSKLETKGGEPLLNQKSVTKFL